LQARSPAAHVQLLLLLRRNTATLHSRGSGATGVIISGGATLLCIMAALFLLQHKNRI